MSGVPYHAWTHRPKAQGGTDPIESSAGVIEWARFQRYSTTNQSITSATNVVIVGTAGRDIVTDSSIFQINTNNTIEMLVDGVVDILGYTNWDTYDGTWRQISVFDVGHVTSSVDYPILMSGSSSAFYDPVSVQGTYRAEVGSKLRLVVHQASGGAQTIYGAGTELDNTNWLEARYLGAWAPP